MTISTTTNRVTYTGNGVTVDFSFPYAFFAKADLVVVETIIATGVQTTKTITTHYTISGSVDALGHYSSGGTVTAVAAPASTVTWTIYRDPTATQTTDLVENDPMPAESIEAALDYQTMLNQRTRDIAARSLQQPEGDSATIDRLPAKVDRASRYLAFDADGDPVATAGTSSVVVVSTFAETLLDDTTAAAARTTLDAGQTTPADNVFRIVGSVDATKKVAFEVDGLTTGTTRTLTVQDANDTLVGRATTDTLTNKTLTAPALSGTVTGTYTLGGTPTIPGALVAGTPLVLNPYTTSSSTTQAHGLGATPIFATLVLECLTAELNYSIGDTIALSSSLAADSNSAAGNDAFVVLLTSTNAQLITGSSGLVLLNKTTFSLTTITAANWKLTVTPYKLQS